METAAASCMPIIYGQLSRNVDKTCLVDNHYKNIQRGIVMVVTATASVTGTMGTQRVHVYLQNYGRYRQIKGIFDPLFEVFSVVLL